MGDPAMESSVFRKSSHSVSQGACVEVGSQLSGAVVIRDSQNISGAWIPVLPNGWRRFISEVKFGDSGER